ncbi:hypothetical protein EON65_34265 [archaeon]|nr:MAG: hypothetical protein EON65_34265 [archaeon]
MCFFVYALLDFFNKVSSQTLHSLHKPLLDIMSKSSELSTALSYSGIFIAALVRRLKAPQEAIVLRTLLKMLQLLHQHHSCPRQFVLDHDLYALVKEFARSEAQVLVCQIANRLLMDFQLSTFT